MAASGWRPEAGSMGPMARRLLTLGAVAAATLVLAGCNVFGDGSFSVGPAITQATAGTYRSSGGPNCYWQRTSDLTGSLSSIIANDLLSGPDVVTILPTDAGFTSQGCGLWAPLPASGPRVGAFGDGRYAIGIDIAPGTYSAPGGDNCYWEQDRDFLGQGDSILSNDLPVGPVTVALSPDAVAFKVQGCGTWSLDATPGRSTPPVMTGSPAMTGPPGMIR